jgi:hypothetical protein
MISRLQDCFSLLAYNNKSIDTGVEYQKQVIQYAPWIISTLLRKRYETFCLLRPPSKPQSLPNFFREQSLKTSTAEYCHFSLSKDAEHYLQQQKSPIELLDLCRLYAEYIDRDTLIFFNNHREKMTHFEGFDKLWSSKSQDVKILINLSIASRTMSIIRLYYADPSEQIQVLECIQRAYPLFVIILLGPCQFSVDEMRYFMEKLMAQPVKNQLKFIQQTAQIFSIGFKQITKTLIDFLDNIQAEKRDQIVRNYLIIGQFLNWNERELSLIREKPDVILQDDFAMTIDSLNRIKDDLMVESVKPGKSS